MQRSQYHTLIYMAMLIAQAVIIGIVEGMIPSPFVFAPGAKLGLSNLITIIAIFTLPIKYSVQVVIARIILTALIGGSASTFLYSMAGGMLSYIAMVLAQRLGPNRVSIIGISVVGGVMHNIGQLSMASMMAQSLAIMNYLPFLSISGIIAGFAVGLTGNFLLDRISILQIYHRDLVNKTHQQNWLQQDES